MKRKRAHDGDDDMHERSKRIKLDSIFISTSEVSLVNLYILHKFLGPFCLMVEEKRAVCERDCSLCNSKTSMTSEYPVDVMQTIKETGVDSYIVDALVRDLYHRGGTQHVHTGREDNCATFTFSDIKHVPWFASHIMLFRCQTVKVDLDLCESSLVLQWSDSKGKEEIHQLRPFVKNVMDSIQKIWLRKNLDRFLSCPLTDE